MKPIRHKPLWARLCAYSLSLLVFLQNLVYPWISILPAPPPIYAQEASPPEASLSASTPAPSPLDLPLDLDTIFPTTQSADLQPPEATPEADLIQVPEATPEASLSPSASPSANPTLTPSPSPTITTSSTSPSPSITGTLDNGNTGTQNTIPTVPSTPIPSLDPFFITLRYPFAGNYPLSYGFGEASDSSYVQLMQNLFDVEAHDGLDFAMPEGTEILSASAGRVIHASFGVYGTTVIIQHSWGRSYYGHLSQTSVTFDQEIAAGQIIGLSGNSGISTGPHLHFGIRPNHYDPFNGYHGMIDPLPYLTGQVLGATSTHKRDFINLPITILKTEDTSLTITLTASDSSLLNFELINPKGESKIVYPTIYNFGTGETAILSRPSPFIPGQYTLRTTTTKGDFDEQSFSWGVLALNSDRATYSIGDRANLAFAVLDGVGQMVCDADLELIIQSPNGSNQILGTKTGEIGVNIDTCNSKDLTITPDYQTSAIFDKLGDYTLTLSATTQQTSYTIIDHLSVEQNPSFSLKRLSATRIYPAHNYPVIFALTPEQDYQGQFIETVPEQFAITSLSESQIKDWSQSTENILASPYTKISNSQLSWDLDLKAGVTYYFGYQYDAPDESPQLFTLGPASLGTWQEARTWSIAVDAVETTVGYFTPPAIWTDAGDASVALAQPNPQNGDLMLATIAIRPSASTVNTPSGWTLLDTETGTDGGAEALDAGSVGLYTFYKVADGSEGSTTVTFTETGTTSVIMGYINKLRSATGTYDLSAGSYGINGDATNWNGTLDTDIGLTKGDVVVIAGAQNGNVAATSAWDISATGITSKSTANEHGEYVTNTGNDVEVDIASAQVWEGTNTATPTIALTLSAAASGAVMAVRVRQGSGTNRTDSWVRSVGVPVGGATSAILPYPEHEMGDLLIAFIGARSTTDVTPTTPAGWTSLGSYNGGSGAFAADAGNARTTAFYKQSNVRYTGSLTVTVTGGSSVTGQMVVIHNDANVTWNFDVDGGTDSTVDTAWSVTGSGIDLNSASGGDLVLSGSTINTDAYSFATPTLTASGITFSDLNLESQYITTNGNDSALTLATARVATGSNSNVAPTHGLTASGTAGSAPAGTAMYIRVNATTITTDDNHLGTFTPPATWTSAGNANLALPQPDPQDGDLMFATIAIRPSASTINTPTGWTLLDSQTGTDGGAEAADTGSVGLYTFYKVADGTEGTATETFTETGTTSAWMGYIHKVRSATGTYDLSSGGYSLNGDATNWNGTLDTDIGLTQGDIVYIIGAQNGDLGAASAWDLTATGISSKSTVVAPDEYVTTTGNDLEIDLATTKIWTGTNTATPAVTLTQSVAASGTVMAVRIRQGSGTNRTDTWVRSAGDYSVGTGTLALNYPDHELGDLFVMLVGTRNSTDNTPTTPVGWNSLGSYNGGSGTFGADAGNTRTTMFYLHTGMRMTGTQSVVLTSGNAMVGQIFSFHKDGNNLSWDLDSDGGTDSTVNTAWSVAGSGIDLDSADSGDLVFIGSSINTDAYTYNTPTLTATGITFSGLTIESQRITTNGNDMGVTSATVRVATGSNSNIAPTYGMTASGTAGSAPAGSTMFVRITGVIPQTITISGTANGNNAATVKVAVNNTIQIETTTISSSAWTITDVPTPTVDDIITVWVDNVSDANESSAVTKWSTGNISGMVLDTNVLTLGSNQDTSLSLTDLNQYDCSEDEDIMHQTASSHLKVEGDSCAGSTTNSYSSEQLSVLASDTLAVATSESITTYDLTNAGTIASAGNSTYNVSHDWANTGTFTPDTSTVNLTGADSTTQTISGTTTFNNLSATTSSNSAGRTLRFTAGTTTTVTGTWTVTGFTGKVITLESSAASTWTLNPTAASVDYTSVSYSTTNLAICATHSTDGGNNHANWSFTSGTSCSSNTAPNAPTSLAQKTTSDVTITTGSWHNNTSVKFSATATDTDNPDTLYLCVEADTIATSFSNAEDSCGSGVSYTGSGVTLTHTLTLTDAQEYHWQVRVKDTAGAYSSWVSYDVNAESARDIGIDSTAPTGGTVYDGTGVGVDITFATSSLSSISANWGSINTDVSGLLRYDYSIGTSPGATNIKAWTDNTTSTSVTATGLTLQTSQLYYVNVRAVDNATNVQTAISSNGQLVSPSISFATTPATATFANLGAGNSYSDTDITTLTTSTNAYNGYVIRAFVTDYLRSTDSLSTISDFSGGTYASPATWSGSETGFGYTSSDTTIQGSNKFGTGSLYAPFTQTGPGDIVADHTTNVTGTSISNESFDITYKVKVDSSQAAKTYNTAVVYTATAQY